MYLRTSDPAWPLVGETVDRTCLLDIIPESVLLCEEASKRQHPAAQVSFVPDEAQPQPPTAGAEAARQAPPGTHSGDGDSGGGLGTRKEQCLCMPMKLPMPKRERYPVAVCVHPRD